MSQVGLFVGSVFFAFSMTPSLLPRLPILQGALSGVVFWIGYGLGVFGVSLWRYFELDEPKGKKRKYILIVLNAVSVFAILYTVLNWKMWQNSILSAMGQSVMRGWYFAFIVIISAFLLFILLLELSRLVRKWFDWFMDKLNKIIPRRISRFLGFVLALLLFLFFVNDILINSVYDFIDRTAEKVNNLTDDGTVKPTDPMKTGSEASLIKWETLGKAGRNFISTGPSAEDISNFTGREAKEPIRIYAGLQSANSYEKRAQLVFNEMLRVGAFDRKVLIITTPTGTGWMDPGAMDTIEYLQDGDTANVSMQYSYLSSPATIIFNPEKAGESAQILFNKIYGYWTTLPKDKRPKLYLFGISLGSFGGEQSTQLHRIMYDPIDGALWAGPPFVNRLHADIVKHRNPDSPYWLPTYEDGSLVRFTSSINNLHNFKKDWKGMRIIYLQYATDPIVFFSPDLLWHRPEWLKNTRGNGVSPLLSWHPIVTMFQVAFDMMFSVAGVPVGHGHNYSPVDYIDSWIELTSPVGWNNDMIVRLKKKFTS